MNLPPFLIRISARFQHQYGGDFQERNVPARPFPLTWNVDVLDHGRSQRLLLASEEHTLYSVLIPASRAKKDVNSFLTPFGDRLANLFRDISWRPPPDVAGVKFSNRNNRRVIGSQNDLLYLTHQLLKDVDKPVSPALIQRIEALLNSTPMSYLGMDCPGNAWSGQLMRRER